MQRKILAVVMATGLWACGGESKPAEPAPAPEPTAAAPEPKAAPFEAKTAFKTVCASCHGDTGEGNGPAAAALNPKPAAFGDPKFWESRDRAHIVKVITEGGAAVGKSPVMVGYGAQYNPEQIGQLADLVMSYKPAAAGAPAGEEAKEEAKKE